MPLYEYRCRSCAETFEVLQRVGADGRELKCPRCGAERPERELSTFACNDGGHSAEAGGGFT